MWTRRDLHPLPRLSKTEFYYINYRPESTIKDAKTKEAPLQGLPLLTNGMSVIYRLRLLFPL